MDQSGVREVALTKLETAARSLRAAIIQGDLKPGQKLNQQELAERLGMSATPIREVLRILEAEGLLTYVPYRGVFVAEVSPERVEEIAPIRVALEGLAVKMGANNLDDTDIAELESLLEDMDAAWKNLNIAQLRRLNYRFHTVIYHASGSIMLCEMIERLWPRFATHVLQMIPGRREQSASQHREILDAIKMRNPKKASELMAEHIMTAGQAIVEFSGHQSVYS
ncbi:MAG: GntR family transcriptional regulator [Anaerolineales bacterium]|nr:GntR family transcriptional regulator [Anaerolineales bacterium]